MVKYLLDTCIIISVLRGDQQMRNTIESVGIQNCAVSEITMAELHIGPARILQNCSAEDKPTIEKARKQILALGKLRTILTVEPWKNSGRTFAEIHEQLRSAGTPIEDMDLLLGSFAVQNNYTLVTGNVKHFERIPSLKIENWYSF